MARKRSEREYLYYMLSRAYEPSIVLSLGVHRQNSYEYYVKCRLRLEEKMADIQRDLKNHDALIDLKKEFTVYRAIYTLQRRKEKKKKGRQRKNSRVLPYLKTLMPHDVLQLITEAEMAQYNDFFEQHPTAARISLKRLLSRKKILKRLREETVTDIFRNIYAADEIKMRIEESLLENPKELYPAARSMHRKFIIHSGMTNTGKTYNAISALKKAKTGVYLGPLRLLAMEIQENLMMDNVMCSMRTGEEESIIPLATHISSTVEMIDLYSYYDTAVIDECQMIADTQRGCAWTRAVLGVRAEEIHLCTAPDAVDILVKLIEDCGDEYELIAYERREPIEYDNSLDTGAKIVWEYEDGRRARPSCEERMKKININKLRYGDALVAFSRSDVLEIADMLATHGIKASVIYGALPYEARKMQLRRFLDRETEVVVATDAIGMGLNLPIRRIIFTTAYKFDGKSYRLLNPSEIKQIAGRAGRKGIYDKGYVYSVAESKYVFKSLTAPYETIEKAYIDFDTAFIEIDSDIREILRAWSIADMPYDIYEKINVSAIVRHIKHIEKLCSVRHYECSKAEQYSLATVTFDDGDKAVFGAWLEYVDAYLRRITELPYPRIARRTVEALESSFKKVDLYYSFCTSMGYTPDLDWIDNMKSYLSDEINYRLTENIDKPRPRGKGI